MTSVCWLTCAAKRKKIQELVCCGAANRFQNSHRIQFRQLLQQFHPKLTFLGCVEDLKQCFIETPEHWGKWRLLGKAAEWGAKGRKSRPKAESEGGFLKRGSKPSVHQLGGRGALWAPSAGFGAEPRPPKDFPLFSALRMASPDTIILLIYKKNWNSECSLLCYANVVNRVGYFAL